jgi:hypothetical protein
MPVELSEIYVAHEQIGVRIRKVSAVSHSEKSRLVTFATQQAGQIESVCAVASTVKVSSIDK